MALDKKENLEKTGESDEISPQRISQSSEQLRVLGLFGQRLVAWRDWLLEFYYSRISAVKQCKPLRGSQSKNLFFFEFSRVSPGDHTQTKTPENSGYEIVIRVVHQIDEFYEKGEFEEALPKVKILANEYKTKVPRKRRKSWCI